jgi:RNA recognition motif-containing protein
MHSSVPDEFKPVLLRGGLRIAFPAPTKHIPAPAGGTQEMVQGQAPRESATADEAHFTSVIFRNIPNDYTRDMFVELLWNEGFLGSVDFVYLPIDERRGLSLGYAFVNLTNHECALRFWKHFAGFNRWLVRSRKVAEVAWSRPTQGLSAFIERFRNSKLMLPEAPDAARPIVLHAGMRLAFPAPTRRL